VRLRSTFDVMGRLVGAWCLGLLTAVTPHAPSAIAAPCEALEGDLRPLPSTSSTDPFAALWAATRAAQLTTVAARIDAADPALTRRLLTQTGCLDPGDTRARASLTQLQPESSHLPRPPVRRVAESELEAIDGALALLRKTLADARFRDALKQADAVLSASRDPLDAPVVRERMASVAVLAATAHTALGDTAAAEALLRKALAWMPGMQLESDASPKVRRLWDGIVQERR